ncbi:hypothetical protein OQA88_9323 [Cercophora sp. LCS_1]
MLFDQVPQAEERAAALTLSHGSSLLSASTRTVGTADSQDGATGEQLHQKWTCCRVNKRIQKLLNEGPDAQSPDAPAEREDEGQTPDQPQWEVQRQQERQTDTQMAPAVPQPQQPPIRVLPPDHRRLVDIYLAYTHSWLPILDRHELTSTLTRFESGPMGPRRERDDGWDVGAGAEAEIWAVFAVASFQNHKAGQPPAQMSPQAIYEIARGLIPSSEDAIFELGHVCALLLLSVIKIGQGEVSAAYLLVGATVRLALLLGYDGRAEIGDDPVSLRKKRVFASCFMLDTLTSLSLGRPTTLRSANVHALTSQPETLGEEDEQLWSPCPGFGVITTRSSEGFPAARSLSCLRQTVLFFQVLNDWTNSQSVDKHRTCVNSLAKSLDGSFSYCNSVVSAVSGAEGDDGNTPKVPSAFFVHATFLAVAIHLGLLSGQRSSMSQIWIFLDLVEGQTREHSPAAIPPLLLGYMDMITRAVGPSEAGRFPTKQWGDILVMLRAVWRPLGNTGQSAQQGTSGSHRLTPGRHPFGFTESVMPSVGTQHFPSPFQEQLVTSNTAQGPAGAEHSLPLQLSSRTTGGQPFYPSPQSTVHSLPFPQMRFTTTFGASVSTDFDAALAEISDIDVFDNHDAEREFLANLGFGPGFDVNDLPSMGFQ